MSGSRRVEQQASSVHNESWQEVTSLTGLLGLSPLEFGPVASSRRNPRPDSRAHPVEQVEANMTRRRVGLWLVGAFGGVGTTITLGLSALARGLTTTTGLVSALPVFEGLDLAEPGDFVIGGHDIRRGSFAESAEEFRRNSGVFDAGWI